MRGDEDEGPSPMIHLIAVIVFEIAFMVLGSMVVAYFSRKREYRADEGGALLAGKEKMVYALESLQRTFHGIDERQKALASLKINSKRGGLFMALLATHPPLEHRIEYLRQLSLQAPAGATAPT